MAAFISAECSAWPRAKLPIALSRVSSRGGFSQLKKSRVRNTTTPQDNVRTTRGFASFAAVPAGGSCVNQRHGGARFYSRPIPGNALVVDPDMRAASRSNTDTRFLRMTVMPLVR